MKRLKIQNDIGAEFDVPIYITEGATSAMTLCVCGDVFRASGSSDEVSRKQAAWNKAHQHCEKPAYEPKTFWLSFCDADRPTGQQFLGACIVDVTPAEVEDAYIEVLLQFPFAQAGAEYIAAAVKKAHALGCNPGGEVATKEMPSNHPNMAFYRRGVLMDRATIESIEARIEDAEKDRSLKP